MELETQNLMTVNFDVQCIANNFNIISTFMQDLQAQVAKLSAQQHKITQNMNANQRQVSLLAGLCKQQGELVRAHEQYIGQMNEQMGYFEEANSEQDQSENKNSKVSRQSRIIQTQYKEQLIQGQKKTIVRKESLVNPPKRNEQKAGTHLNPFQRALLSIRERITDLQQENELRKANIQTLTKHIQTKKHKNTDPRPLRTSKTQLVSKQNIRNQTEHDQSQPTDKQIYERMKRNSSKSFKKGMFDMQLNLASENSIQEDIQDRVNILAKEFLKMRQSFMDKTRIIDLQLKENTNKMQNIQKNLDMLERSHELLQYDYEHNQGQSFHTQKDKMSNLLSPQSVPRRRDPKLNQTAITNKQGNDDRINQLISDVEMLKNDYMDLLMKFDKDQDQHPEETTEKKKQRMATRIMQFKQDNNQQLRKQIRKQMNRLRQQFEELLVNGNSGSIQTKTILIKPNQTKQDWKNLSTKMQKLKVQLQAGVKQLEGKIVTSNDLAVIVNQLVRQMQDCKSSINKKVQSKDHQKSLKRIQTRLNNFIMQVYEQHALQNQNQGSISKHPWMCLSCDSQLKHSGSKLMRAVAAEQKLPGRKVNPQSHMVRRNENNKLPSVAR